MKKIYDFIKNWIVYPIYSLMKPANTGCRFLVTTCLVGIGFILFSTGLNTKIFDLTGQEIILLLIGIIGMYFFASFSIKFFLTKEEIQEDITNTFKFNMKVFSYFSIFATVSLFVAKMQFCDFTVITKLIS